MRKRPKCKNCEYWIREDRKDDKRVGQCIGGLPQMGPNGYGYWPVIDENEGCFAGNPLEAQLLTEDVPKPVGSDNEIVKDGFG